MWTYRARLVRAIDGDTIRVELDLGFDVRVVHDIRVAGVDTPELRGGTQATREAAQAARRFTEQWCTAGAHDGWPLTVTTSRSRSFTRYVGSVERGGRSLARSLVGAGHAVTAR